ncbi:hypothetical protein [Candidatus Solincola sp.]|jgi:glycerophosphoryl diester phosphodiesterase|nr:hypothetical protein [Actinomycetota bacterium]
MPKADDLRERKEGNEDTVVDGTNGTERGLLLVSHRGGGGFGPENTQEALRAALDFGVGK